MERRLFSVILHSCKLKVKNNQFLMEQYIGIYGYAIQAAGCWVEGEIAIISASIAASRQILDIRIVIIIAFTVTIISDWFHFFIGRIGGKKLMKYKPHLFNRFAKMNAFFQKYPLFILLIYRFIYGFRVFLPITIGISSISTKLFLFCSVLSTAVWVLVISLSGYYFGEMLRPIFDRMIAFEKEFFIILLSVIVGIFILKALWKWLKNNKLKV